MDVKKTRENIVKDAPSVPKQDEKHPPKFTNSSKEAVFKPIDLTEQQKKYLEMDEKTKPVYSSPKTESKSNEADVTTENKFITGGNKQKFSNSNKANFKEIVKTPQ